MTKKKQDIIEISGIKGKGEDANGLWWVNKARSNDETRQPLFYIYIKYGYATASDGRRMHRYKLNSEVKDGLYSPLICKKNQVGLERVEDSGIIYPAFDSLLMERPEDETLPYLNKDINIAIGHLLRMADDNHYINCDFLLQAMRGHKETFEIWHTPQEDTNPFYLRSENRTAIIMPMRSPC